MEKLTSIPVPSESVIDDIENLMTKMDGLRELLWNKEIVSIRLVTTLERIVIQETKRCFSYLHLYNYNVDAIFANKIYPEEALKGYFHKWSDIQIQALSEIKESFAGIPIFYMELQKNELRTIPRLNEISENLYGRIDPSEVLFRRTIFTTATEDGKEVYSIMIPFFDTKDMELLQKGEELTLIIKNERSRFILPHNLKKQRQSNSQI